MTVAEIKASPFCELATYFLISPGRAAIPTTPTTVLLGHRGQFPANHTHHLIGQTKRGRSDHPSNILRVSSAVHDWLHGPDHCAGQVLCCWQLYRTERLDWEFISAIDHRCWPGLLETDKFRIQCERYAFIEEFRRQLIRIKSNGRHGTGAETL